MIPTQSPGPWNIAKHATPDWAPQFGIYSGVSNKDLAIVVGENSGGDALLIAAAPDLLDTVKYVDRYFEARSVSRWGGCTLTEEGNALWALCQEVIRKATII